jgi:hypothetical protein
VAGGLGFEPRLAESESAVLPLDDPPMPESDKSLRLQRFGAWCDFRRGYTIHKGVHFSFRAA